MTGTRRHALKLLGTVGATCAFPFAGDELYGQHVQAVSSQAPAAEPYKPSFLTQREYATLARLADAIIPSTDTPGASAAGVPEYIDRVVTLNAQHQPLMRAGLAWLDAESKSRFSMDFVPLKEEQQVALLQPLSDAADRQQREAMRARFRTNDQGALVYYFALTDENPVAQSPSAVRRSAEASKLADLPVRFFRLVKNLTADGYYTSRVGLLQELGYTGNTALARFPGCGVSEH